MRKFFAYLCYAAEFASMSVAGIFSYTVYKGETSFDLGMLIFIPLMIMSYWFSTFGYQLANLKCTDGSKHCILNKRVNKILSSLSTIITFGLMIFWVYLYLWQQGYTTIYF